MQYNFVDIIIVLLVALSAIKGYKNGLLGSIVNFFGSIIALIFAIKFYKPVVQALEAKFNLVSSFSALLGEKIPLPVEVGTLPVGTNGISLLKASIEQMVLPSIIKEQMIIKIQELLQFAGQLGITTTGELLSYLIALTFINGIALILLWLLIKQIIMLTSRIFSNTLDHTLLGTVNHFAGVFIGASLSILGLMITLGLTNLLLQITQGVDSDTIIIISDKLNQSLLVPYLQLGYDMILAKIITFI